MTATKEPTPVDRDELLRFVEQFALVLTDTGLPRTAARVFAYALAEDAERYTAGELAAGLRLSPAAVSGAVRLLVQIGLLGREREPGSRSDLYRVYDDDVWYHIYLERMRMLERYEVVAAEGVHLLGSDRPGGRRIEETRAFFAFVRTEWTDVMERWHEQRKTMFGDG